MNPQLNIASDLSLPIEAVTQTFAILAKRGVGKTYTASVMAEEMLKSNLHVVIVDPIDDKNRDLRFGPSERRNERRQHHASAAQHHVHSGNILHHSRETDNNSQHHACCSRTTSSCAPVGTTRGLSQ